MVSFLRPPLEKLGCECYFADSYQEISELLSRNKLRIVLSLNCYQNLSEMVPLLAGQCVSMFQVLRVEKGCWWLPVLRNGLDCLGASAFSPQEFTYILAEIVMGIHINATANKPCDSSCSNPSNGRVGPGNFTPSLSQVGSRTGATPCRLGLSVALRFL
jgi:hypothetical protein